jgi:hypothetical protein
VIRFMLAAALLVQAQTGQDALHRLVPDIDAASPRSRPPGCGADAHGALHDRRQERQLIAEANRLSWADVPNFGDTGLRSPGTKMKRVRVTCGPDIDGDGFAESVVRLTFPYRVASGEELVEVSSIDLIFLASRRASRWHAVAPIGIDGSIPGVEGSIDTSAWFVTLADGRAGVAVKRMTGGGGDCDCHTEEVSIVTLERGGLQTQGTFNTGRPCACELM